MKREAAMGTNASHILLFDGICNLCSSLVRFIDKRDRKGVFTTIAMQSEAGQQWLKRYDLPVRDFKSLVYIEDSSRYFLKSTAVLQILKKMGGLWKLAYVFIIIPRPLRDLIYDLIANTRYKIYGKRDTCLMPTRSS